MKTRKKWISITFVAVLLFFCVVIPTKVAWRARWTLATNLAGAQSVSVEQFTLGGRNVVASRSLSASDYGKLLHAFPYSLSYEFGQKMCFVPHHRIVITTHDGATFDCYICFTCDMYSMPSIGAHDMPVGWSGTLRRLFADVGILPRLRRKLLATSNYDMQPAAATQPRGNYAASL